MSSIFGGGGDDDDFAEAAPFDAGDFGGAPQRGDETNVDLNCEKNLAALEDPALAAHIAEARRLLEAQQAEDAARARTRGRELEEVVRRVRAGTDHLAALAVRLGVLRQSAAAAGALLAAAAQREQGAGAGAEARGRRLKAAAAAFEAYLGAVGRAGEVLAAAAEAARAAAATPCPPGAAAASSVQLSSAMLELTALRSTAAIDLEELAVISLGAPGVKTVVDSGELQLASITSICAEFSRARTSIATGIAAIDQKNE